MDEHDVLAERFEAHRSRLRAVTYQALGSPSEADDAVQETWLRLSRTDSGNIGNLGGWLTTVVARVCLNMLKSRRDEPAGVHLPESVASDANGIDPEIGVASQGGADLGDAIKGDGSEWAVPFGYQRKGSGPVSSRAGPWPCAVRGPPRLSHSAWPLR